MPDDAPAAVTIAGIDMPFWQLVSTLVVFWFAVLLSLAIVALIPLAILFVGSLVL